MLENIKWTDKKIDELSSEDYHKYRKEIKEFYENKKFRIRLKKIKNQMKRKKTKKSSEEMSYKEKLTLLPWFKYLRSAISRCECESNSSYFDYGFQGICCYLTEYEIERIWGRDEPWKMKDPTLDRIDPLWHYTYNNCQFIERVENTKRARKMQKYMRLRKTLDYKGDWTQLEYLKKFEEKFPDFAKIRQKDSRRYDIPIYSFFKKNW